jgi:hypothetical protein
MPGSTLGVDVEFRKGNQDDGGRFAIAAENVATIIGGYLELSYEHATVKESLR